MQSVMKKTSIRQVAVFTSTLAFGLGCVVSYAEPVRTATPMVKRQLIEQERSDSEAFFEKLSEATNAARGLAGTLRDLYVMMTEEDDSQGIDYEEYAAKTDVLREHERELDAMIARWRASTGEAPSQLMTLRRSVAEARANSNIVASLARQYTGDQNTFRGAADPAGLRALAAAGTRVAQERMS